NQRDVADVRALDWLAICIFYHARYTGCLEQGKIEVPQAFVQPNDMKTAAESKPRGYGEEPRRLGQDFVESIRPVHVASRLLDRAAEPLLHENARTRNGAARFVEHAALDFSQTQRT